MAMEWCSPRIKDNHAKEVEALEGTNIKGIVVIIGIVSEKEAETVIDGMMVIQVIEGIVMIVTEMIETHIGGAELPSLYIYIHVQVRRFINLYYMPPFMFPWQ